jgi:hypothetical protein
VAIDKPPGVVTVSGDGSINGSHGAQSDIEELVPEVFVVVTFCRWSVAAIDATVQPSSVPVTSSDRAAGHPVVDEGWCFYTELGLA